MRLDHIAYRVADRHKTAEFFIKAFGYTIQTEFDIEFDDGTKARCIALEPPEKANAKQEGLTCFSYVPKEDGSFADDEDYTLYHMAPEIFVSDGENNSIVGQWVAKRDGVGGIHHIAYQVDSVEAKMKEWQEKGYAEFTSDKPLTCPGLTQVFTKPSQLTGVIYEFIERGTHGFCKDNVKNLMESTREVENDHKA